MTSIRPLHILSLLLLLTLRPAAVLAQCPPGHVCDAELLIAEQGVSGFERGVIAAIARHLPPWARPRTDSAGNLIVTIGTGAPHVLVTTSVDEDGYLVSRIMDDGYLRLTRMSTGAAYRLFDQFLYGQPVIIGTGGAASSPIGEVPPPLRPVPGVAASASSHLQRGRDASPAIKGLDDLWVDVGVSSRSAVEALGIRLLDPVALRDRGQRLAGGRLAGVAAQARGAAWALVRLLADRQTPPAIAGTLTIAWTTQGLFGDRGLARLAQQIAPDRAIIVRRASLGREADPRGRVGRLGGGPVVAAEDTTLIERARHAGVVVQTAPAGRASTPWPAATSVTSLALPVMFALTPVETIQEDDVRALTALIGAQIGLPPTSPRQVAVSSTRPPAAEDVWSRLERLVLTYGVSGHEAAVREAVRQQLPAWATPSVDEKGNLTVTFGQGPRDLLFVAHTDELGYEIVAIQEDGTATLRRRGGFTDSLLEARPLLVHTTHGPVPAIMPPRSGYASATETQMRPADVLAAFGTDSRQGTEGLGVAPGDAVTVTKMFTRLGGGRATARSVDDRAGCAALLMALTRIDPARVRARVTFAWVVEEETGLAGSGALAERLHPTYAFAVDTFVSSDSPVDPPRMAHVMLGSGAVLRAVDNSSITPPSTYEAIRALAAARGIPTSVGVTNGGNDGSRFSRHGSIVVPISWPGRYSHSAVEVIDGRDLQALVDLIVLLVGEWG